MVKIILVSHGPLAESLLKTAAEICCFKQDDLRVCGLNEGKGLEDMTGAIADFSRQGEVLVLADTFGGSCCNTALSFSSNLKNVNVVCGVNLNMLLTALNNMDKLNLAQLTQKVVDNGKKAIFNASEILKQ